jgi:uncharacterized protein (DUF433 family)
MTEHTDRRETPRYTATEVANYIKLPESTVRAWFFGQPNFERLFVPASEPQHLLSFFNIIEAHAVAWTKQKYPSLRLPRIRAALQYVSERFPQYSRPLVTKAFSTDGKFLFINQLAQESSTEEPMDAAPPINASKWGQLALPILSEYLELVEYDERDLARILYPRGGARVVVINPALSSGRPVVKGTGVLASIIWQRAKRAREPIERLVRDYKLGPSEIQAAIDYIEAA